MELVGYEDVEARSHEALDSLVVHGVYVMGTITILPETTINPITLIGVIYRKI